MINSKVRFHFKYFILVFLVYCIDGKATDSNETFVKEGIESIEDGEGIDESINKQQTSPPIAFKSQDLNFETVTIPSPNFAYGDTKLIYGSGNYGDNDSDYSGGSVGLLVAVTILILIGVSCCVCCIRLFLLRPVRSQRASVNERPRRGFAYIYRILVVERRAGVGQPAGFANSALVTDDEQRRDSDMPPSYETIVPERQWTNSTLRSTPVTLPVAQNITI